jgi:hypothetical protein
MTSYIEIIVFTAFIVFMALDGFYSEALRALRVLKVLGAFRALIALRLLLPRRPAA